MLDKLSKSTETYVLSTVLEATKRTLEGNNQDFVENLIDVAFEPIEKITDGFFSLFDW